MSPIGDDRDRLVRRLGVTLALLLGAAVGTASPAAGTTTTAPSAAAPVGCAASDVLVVVADGVAVRTGCAGGDPGSGLAALSAAGFDYSFVPRQPGLVCRIDDVPARCNGAPADAYWSYWHADPGGRWVYSSVGAGSFDPKPGSAEGWAFGAGTPPPTASVSAVVSSAAADTATKAGTTPQSSTPSSARTPTSPPAGTKPTASTAPVPAAPVHGSGVNWTVLVGIAVTAVIAGFALIRARATRRR